MNRAKEAKLATNAIYLSTVDLQMRTPMRFDSASTNLPADVAAIRLEDFWRRATERICNTTTPETLAAWMNNALHQYLSQCDFDKVIELMESNQNFVIMGDATCLKN